MLQLIFNVRHAPLDDVAVREGIAHAIDRADIVTTIAQPLDSSIWEDNNHIFANSQPQYMDDASGYVTADPATAARLLSQGGLVPDAQRDMDRARGPGRPPPGLGAGRSVVRGRRARPGRAARDSGFRRHRRPRHEG